jgi:FMN hydrolase / 5-amino-6-(5-phospho-D-ribitylamino)uracil phosphatase
MLHYSKIQAISLDLDDTLWPIGPVIVRAEQALQEWLQCHAPQTASLCALPDTKRAMRSQVEQRFPEFSHDLSFLRRESIRASLVAAGDPSALAEAAFDVFFAARNAVSLYPGVAQALSQLAARYTLVALSNGNADVFRTEAAAHFHSAISAQAFGVAKPDVRIFHATAAQLNLDPEAVLHVGDDAMADAFGALNAGMQAVWINAHGQVWDEQLASHPSYQPASPRLRQPLTVSHLSELCDHLLS